VISIFWKEERARLQFSGIASFHVSSMSKMENETRPSPSDELSAILSSIPCTTELPHFENVRPLLYNLFALESGPAIMLITHYYVTGRPRNNEEFLYDPAAQAHWCTDNLTYFGEVAKRLRQVRNKLVHREVLTTALFKSALSALILFSKKDSKAACVLDLLLTQLLQVCRIIVSPHDINIGVCPLCRSSLTVSSGVDVLKQALVPQVIEPVEQEMRNVLCAPMSSAQSLRYWRDNGWKGRLKGCEIMIMGGKWMNYSGYFRSWAGTVAYIDLETIGRKAVRIETLVSVKLNGSPVPVLNSNSQNVQLGESSVDGLDKV
jgi:hypothetical protein